MGPRSGRHRCLGPAAEGLVLHCPHLIKLLLLIPPYGGWAVFLASGGHTEGVKPITFDPFCCSSAGHLQLSTIHLVLDVETM